jgi:FkbM family methyltransferase
MYNTLHKFKISHVIDRNIITEKFLPFKLFYKLFKKLNCSRKVNRNGASFTILIKRGMGIMNFISNYETWLDEILPMLIEKEDAVFFDIGANTGQTMIKVLPHFPKVRYYAFEPNGSCVDYLQSLCALNHFSTVKIFDYALSDTEGEVELLMRYQDDMLATTSPKFRKFTKYATKKKVRMTTGDALVSKESLAEISIIKIDVEGGEAKVIEGLLKTIKSFQPLILCEILPIISEDKGVTEYRKFSASQMLSRMYDLNYSILNIATGNLIKGIKDLSSSLESCNYLFVPKSKNELIAKL